MLPLPVSSDRHHTLVDSFTPLLLKRLLREEPLGKIDDTFRSKKIGITIFLELPLSVRVLVQKLLLLIVAEHRNFTHTFLK